MKTNLLKGLKTFEVYQICKDCSLSTAIWRELLDAEIVNEDEDVRIIFFNKDNKRNGKSLVSIEGEIFAVTQIYRFNTIQSCTLIRIGNTGNYIPE